MQFGDDSLWKSNRAGRLGFDGVRRWTVNGKLHRRDGPAVIWPTGRCEEWWLEGELHREDGPAITNSNGWLAWYYKGDQYDFEEWLQLVPISDEEKVMLKLKYG